MPSLEAILAGLVNEMRFAGARATSPNNPGGSCVFRDVGKRGLPKSSAARAWD